MIYPLFSHSDTNSGIVSMKVLLAFSNLILAFALDDATLKQNMHDFVQQQTDKVLLLF
jgi:hypothetical protein